MVVNTREHQSWVGGAVEASAAASASAASTSSSAAASPSAAASATTSAAAPATEAPGLLGLLEALDLLGGTGGGGPSLYRLLGGLGLDNRPNVLADFLTLHDLDVGCQRSARTIADAPPTVVHRY